MDYFRKTKAELIEEIRRLKNGRQNGQDALESLSRYEFIVNTSRDFLSLIDSAYRYEAVNEAYCAAHAKSRQELVGHTVAEVWGTEVFESVIKKWLDRCFRGEEVRYKDRFRFSNLGARMMEVTYYPYRAASGDITHVVVVSRDVTVARKAEEELLALKKAVETMQLGVTISDTGGRIIYVNPADARMHGYQPEELAGREVRLFAPDHTWKPRSVKSLREITSWSRRCQNLRKDGSTFPVHLMSDVVTGPDGEPLGIVTTCEDITKTVQAEEQISAQIRKLTTLREIDMMILSSLDMKVVLSVLLGHLRAHLGVDAARVMTLNPHTLMLEHAASAGFQSRGYVGASVKVGLPLAGEVALERTPIMAEDLGAETLGQNMPQYILAEDFVFYFGIPLIAKGAVKGTMEIFHRSPLRPDADWTEFVDVLAGQAAIAIDNVSMFNDIQRSNMELMLAYDSTLEGWSRALDLRDKETEGHSRRVTENTVRLAQEFGIGQEEMVHIRRGAMLHDIGKMGVPDSILLKPGPLDNDEWKVMKLHPVYAYEMLSPITFLRPALDIPYCHHEKWDGTGYPRGLKGQQIPLAARIFSVIDNWDALRSDRPYRPAWSRSKVRAYLRELSGSAFDPSVVDKCLELDL